MTVKYGQRGYIGTSRSVRSQEAIERGLVTKSELKAWQKRAVESGAVCAAEWHHTGKFAQKTDYFDLEAFEGLGPSDFPPSKKYESAAAEDAFGVSGTIAVWEGSGKRKRLVGYSFIGVTTSSSLWIEILKGGCGAKKKKKDGNNISWEKDEAALQDLNERNKREEKGRQKHQRRKARMEKLYGYGSYTAHEVVEASAAHNMREGKSRKGNPMIVFDYATPSKVDGWGNVKEVEYKEVQIPDGQLRNYLLRNVLLYLPNRDD